ncbi:MAG: hypothetical protein ACYTBP_09080 [Planctomycetota bacterium]|jgi:hypothetical protein
MKNNKYRIVIIILLLFSKSMFAHDLSAPSWRGEDGTTFQHFGFDCNDNPASPEIINNPFGISVANIVLGSVAEGWLEDLPGLGTQTGIWGLGSAGTITVNVTTGFENTGQQEVWVQLTYLEDPWWETPQLQITDANLIKVEPLIEVENVGMGSVWYLRQSKWLVDQGTSIIEIVVTSDIMGGYIDQIVVDTRTVSSVCIVNCDDLDKFSDQWLMSGDNLDADFNDSNTVDFFDYSILANQWFKNCPDDWPF